MLKSVVRVFLLSTTCYCTLRCVCFRSLMINPLTAVVQYTEQPLFTKNCDNFMSIHGMKKFEKIQVTLQKHFSDWFMLKNNAVWPRQMKIWTNFLSLNLSLLCTIIIVCTLAVYNIAWNAFETFRPGKLLHGNWPTWSENMFYTSQLVARFTRFWLEPR